MPASSRSSREAGLGALHASDRSAAQWLVRPGARAGARRAALAFAMAIAIGSWTAGPARAGVPPEHECPTLGGDTGAEDGTGDAGGVTLREGQVIQKDDLLALRKLFPRELWVLRDTFFYEGMRLVVGPCHRRYPVASFYAEATREHAGSARLDEDGNLAGYTAGLPFPPESIDPEAPGAGARWAWNLELRYRGAGPVGRFKIVDLPSRIGQPQTYKGRFFHVRTGHRADLAESGHHAGSGDENLWVAGGRFTEPFDARHLAWRQLRPLSTLRDPKQPDSTFVYVPTMRKPRRAASNWSDGLFTPGYTVSGIDSGGPLVVPGGQGFGVGAINPGGGQQAVVTEDLRRGFTGLALRPNAYDWKLQGERDVLAPLNVKGAGYPESEQRNWGPSGLSIAGDTWDLRRAVVLEGTPRVDHLGYARLTVYVDLQTQQPLYWITRRKNGLLHEVGILAHRFSSDRLEYPLWPEGETQPDVFDPVAAVFYSAASGGAGWRRESFGLRSVPVSEDRLRDMTSTIPLMRGR